MDFNAIPAKVDTIRFCVPMSRKTMQSSNLLPYDYWKFRGRADGISAHYDSVSNRLSVRIDSLPEFMFGYSQFEFDEESYPPIEVVRAIQDALYDNFNINISKSKLKRATVTELHINKDVFFEKKRNSERFLRFMKNFNRVVGKKAIKKDYKDEDNDYDLGSKYGNKSKNLTVYDKGAECEEHESDFLEINNCPYCIRIEKQLRSSALKKLPKVLGEDKLKLGQILQKETLNAFWDYYVGQKDLLLPNILSKAQLKKHILNSNYRSTENGRESMWKTLQKAESIGLAKAFEDFSQMPNYMKYLKENGVCPIFLGLQVIKDIERNNLCEREITNIINN